MLSNRAPLVTRGVRHDGADRLSALEVPDALATTLGCDAVGLPAHYGIRLLARMRSTGCVFADGFWWWWIVPAGSDLDLTWPLPSHYARGAQVPTSGARLIRRPDGPYPYTPPIPLYLMVCQLTGTEPLWHAGLTASAQS